jgi:uncharacterized membrane protein YgdD (TMEM256/DUF423 family)
MPRFFAVFASLSGLLWVALRAIGSHAWAFDAKNLNRFEQACSLLIVHALVLLLLSQMQTQRFLPMRLYAGLLFVVGMWMFSGSLIWLSRGGPAFLSQTAPIGGMSLMLGWLCLAIASLKKPALGK